MAKAASSPTADAAAAAEAANVDIARLDRRARLGSVGLGVLLIPLSLLAFLLDPNWVFLAACVLAIVLLLVMPRVERDAATLFIVVHPSITFLATTLIYAAAGGNFALAGLVDKTTSTLIVLAYQASIVVAYFISRLFNRKPVSAAKAGPRQLSPRMLRLWAALSIAAVYCVQVLPSFNAIQSFSPVFLAGFCYCIAALAMSPTSRPRPLVIFFISATLILPESLLVNERTDFFVVLLIWLVIALALTDRLLRLRFAVIALLAYFLAMVSTQAFLDVRDHSNSSDPVSVAMETAAAAVSPDVLMAAVPFTGRPKPLSYSERTNRNYSEVLSSNGTEQELSLLSRFALLARMDVATGRLGPDLPINWAQWGTMLLSTMPNVGQTKDLIFSDEIVWDLGLRGRETIGRPLVTVPGELYALGGYLGLVVASMVLYFLLFLEIKTVRRAIEYNVPYIATIIAFTFDITMTGGSLNLMTTVRNFFLLLIGLLLIRRFGSSKPAAQHRSPRLLRPQGFPSTR